MNNQSVFLAIPILALLIGLVGCVGHYMQNYFRMKHGYAPLNQHGHADPDAPLALQNQVSSLKGEVDRLRGIEMDVERLKSRVATLEKIATDPAIRLASEINTLV